jgi:hypothetical protein
MPISFNQGGVTLVAYPPITHICLTAVFQTTIAAKAVFQDTISLKAVWNNCDA